jgi:hypothetical protein
MWFGVVCTTQLSLCPLHRTVRLWCDKVRLFDERSSLLYYSSDGPSWHGHTLYQRLLIDIKGPM